MLRSFYSKSVAVIFFTQPPCKDRNFVYSVSVTLFIGYPGIRIRNYQELVCQVMGHTRSEGVL